MKIKVALLHDLLMQVTCNKISFSRMCELINEEANKPESEEQSIINMKSVNCLTRCLWHWEKYGGEIIYDSNHATVINSDRHYHDHVEMYSTLDIKGFGIDYFINAHSDFLNDEEIEILKRYFES